MFSCTNYGVACFRGLEDGDDLIPCVLSVICALAVSCPFIRGKKKKANDCAIFSSFTCLCLFLLSLIQAYATRQPNNKFKRPTISSTIAISEN